MKNNRFNADKGFSLIELMITCAIIGVLGLIALPGFLEQIQKTKRSDGKIATLDCAAKQRQRFTISNQFSEDDVCEDVSDEGHYSLEVVVGGNPDGTAFEVRATAVGSQASDTECSVFVMSNTGFKGAVPSENAEKCWQ